MARKTVTWSDFSAGEFGSLDPRKAPEGSWTGLNVLCYVDGSIGPRPGFERATTINDAAATLQLRALATAQRQLPANSERDIFVGMLSGATAKVYGYNSRDDTDKAFLTGTPDLGGANEDFPDFVRSAASADRRVYIGGPDLNRVDETTVTEVTAPSITVASLAYYKDRLVGGWGRVSAASATPNRIVFSNVQDPETWSSIDFFPVGSDFFGIVDVISQRSHLVITKVDGSWWVLTGTLGSTNALRKVAQGEALSASRKALGLANGEVWYWSGISYCPVLFDGSRLISLNHLRLFSSGTITATGAQLSGPGDMIWLVSDGTTRKLVTRINGAWSIHTEATGTVMERLATLEGNLVVTVGETSTSDVDVPIFISEWGLERPPFEENSANANRWEAMTDDGASTAPATLLRTPQEWSDSDEFVCRAVTVDFKTWATDESASDLFNHFDIKTTVHGRWEGSPLDSETLSFDEDPTAASVTGTEQTRTFYFADQGSGRGFDVSLSNLRGVSIRAVTAHYDTQPSRVS